MGIDSHRDDRRHFSRVQFETTVQLSSQNGNWSCRLIDISLKGVLVEQPENFRAPESKIFTLELPLNQSDITISMELTLVHANDGRLGFSCTHFDLDSIAHLKRLMELNLGDAELVHRELSELG